MQISKIIARPPVTVPLTTTVRMAAATMVEEAVGALLVTSAGRLVGILSERDIVALVAEDETGSELDESVEAYMIADPYTVPSTSSVGEAARVMSDKGVRHLPVVDEDGLHGIVSIRDLMYAALDESAEQARVDWIEYLLPDVMESPADGG